MIATDIATAVWVTHTPRTMATGTPGAATNRAERIAAAVWTYATRTLTAYPPPVVIIKHGAGAPTTANLSDFQLGYDSTGNILYIRDGSGIVAINGRMTHVATVTNTYDILITDDTVVCNKSSAFTVTLPTAVVGQRFSIKNINTGVVTLEGKDAETIDGELNQALYQWEAMHVQCYEAGKWVIL